MNRKKVVRTILGSTLLAVFVFCILLFGSTRLNRQKTEAAPMSESVSEQTPGPVLSSSPESTPEPTPDPTESPSPEPGSVLPDIDLSSWEYTLVNSQHSIGDYAPELAATENGQYFDSRALASLDDFIAAAREQSLTVYLSSAYRDFATQKYLYENKVAEYGETIAKTIVALPGTSEHQLGLAADITDKYYQYKNESLADTELFQWMSDHCAEYGFIVRYPEDKTDITGVMYEPWHFRYVGVEAATYIMENGLCLEEFVALYE